MRSPRIVPPTLVPLVALLSGAAVGVLLAPAGPMAVVVGRLAALALAAGVGLACVAVTRRPSRGSRGSGGRGSSGGSDGSGDASGVTAPAWLLLGVALAFASGGLLLALQAWRDAWQPSLRQAFEAVAGPDDGVVCEVVGVLRGDAAPTADGDGVSLSLWVTAIDIRARIHGREEQPVSSGAWRRPGPRLTPVQGGVQLQVAGELAGERIGAWRDGRRVRLVARLRRPQVTRNPGASDGARALARRGSVLVGSVKSAALVQVEARGSWWRELASTARARIRRSIARHVGRWDQTAAAIVTAILIGDRAGLAVDVQRALQEAGTYHVIAISGGNIAILAAVILTLFRWGGVLGRAAMVAAIALFLVYGAIVSGGPSVSRAITVAVLAFAARAFDLRMSGGRSLLLAAALLVAVDPLTLADPGFLLSFGATAGILALSPLATRRFANPGHGSSWGDTSMVSALVSAAVPLLVASVAAELALLPIVATFFGRLTVAGLVLNFAAIPLMAVAQMAGMAVVPLALLPVLAPLADAVGWLAAMTASGLVTSASLVDWMPRAAWRVAAPAPWSVAVYYVAGAVALVLLHARHKGSASRSPSRRPSAMTGAPTVLRVALAATCAAGIWIAAEPWRWLTAAGDGRLHVMFLDVGQGDAAFLRFPRGSTMLVDTGGAAGESFDVGDRVVTPALLEAGVHRLGSLVLTHWDADHAGGAPGVLRALTPMDVWEGTAVPRLPLRQQARAAAHRAHSRWTTVRDGDVTEIEGVRVRVLHPPPADWERQDPRNDDSIVLDVQFGAVSFVFTGDIGREVERSLVEGSLTGTSEPAIRRVLKVPHHGSATSSSAAFLDHLRPTVAIVSAGRGNPFGHPAPAVTRRYDTLGTPLYRTDQDGAITVTTDGHELEVHTFTGRSAYWPPVQ